MEKRVNGSAKTGSLHSEVNAKGEGFVTLKFGTQTLQNGVTREIWFWFSLFQSKKCLMEVTSHFHRLVIQVDKIRHKSIIYGRSCIFQKEDWITVFLFCLNRRVEKIHHIFWEFIGRQKNDKLWKGHIFSLIRKLESIIQRFEPLIYNLTGSSNIRLRQQLKYHFI